jgi:PST family polysaccharide transporter
VLFRSVRDLVQRPESESRILGTYWRLRLAGSVLAAISCIALYLLLGRGTPDGIVMIMLLVAAVILLEPVSVTVLWFQANRQLKPVGIARTVGYAMHQGFRLLAVGAGMSIVAIAGGALLEAVVICTLLLYAYSKSGATRLVGSWDAGEAKRIVRQGIPVMVGALLGTLFLRIDQVILGQLSGNHELGIYSAAVRLSEVWWVLPAIVMQAIAPRLFYASSHDAAALQHRLTMMSCVLFYVALVAAAVTTVAADWLVPVLLGQQFTASQSVLVIHAWIAIFVFLDAAAYQYLITRNLQRFIILRSGLALVVNAGAALLLAPAYGAPGVAMGALIAYFFGSVVSYLFSPETRVIAVCQLRGLTKLPEVVAVLAARQRRSN